MLFLNIILSTQILASIYTTQMPFGNVCQSETCLPSSQNNHLHKERNYSKEPLTDYQRVFIYNLFKVFNEKPLNEIILNTKDNLMSKSVLVMHNIHPQVLFNFIFQEIDENILKGIINNEEKLNFLAFFFTQEINKKVPLDEIDSFIVSICAEAGCDESVVKNLFHEKKFKDLLLMIMDTSDQIKIKKF
ncbi:MAG: hypothetical protein FJZ57_07540 [Chlamydiae bacterium]|nr:hypothetical protein [Chlamydiota bacterium]